MPVRAQHGRVRTIVISASLCLFMMATILVVGPATPVAWAQPDVGEAPDTNSCYGVADEAFGTSGSAPDGLSRINRSNGATTNIGGDTGTTDVEAIAFAPGTIIDAGLTQQVLYTFDGVDFGFLNLTTGEFSSLNLPEPAGFTTVDGMTWDADLQVFWITDRLGADGAADSVAGYDPFTGATTIGPFSTGIATEPGWVNEAGLPYDDFDDVAIDPQADFRLYALLNKGGTDGGLVELSKTDGSIIDYVGLFTPDANSDFDGDGVTDDLEGLAFFDDRQLYGSTGANGPGEDINRLFLIDLDSGSPITTYIGDFVGYGDYEALGCLTVGASIEVEKGTSEPGAVPEDADEGPGPTITTRTVEWTYVITNTSAALDLFDVTLDDDPIGALFDQQTGQSLCAQGAILAPGELLAPGESVTCTVTGETIVGPYTNTATTTAIADPGPGLRELTVSDIDPSNYVGEPSPPVLDVVKTVVEGANVDCSGITPVPGDGPIVSVASGAAVTFCITVTNTGGSAAAAVTVVDNNATPADPADDVIVTGLDNIDLAAGESATGSFSVPVTSLTTLLNTVVATGTDPVNGTATNSPSDTAQVQAFSSPELAVVKTVVAGTSDCAGVTPAPGLDDITVELGDTITFCVTVTNTGLTPAANVTVVDDNLTPGDAADDVNVPGLVDITLAAGESATGALVIDVPNAGINTVTATGTDPNTGQPTNSPTDPAELRLLGVPVLTVVKTVVVGEVNCDTVDPQPGLDDVTLVFGQTITFCVTVTNTGDTTAQAVTVVDDNYTPAVLGDDIDVPGLIDITLLPGVSATGAIVTTASQAGVNTVTATGTDPNTGQPTNSPTDPAEVRLEPAGRLEVVKTIVAGTSDCVGVTPAPGLDEITVEVGETITYCVTVTNPGPTFLTGVTVIDDSLTPVDPADDVAVPGLTDIRLDAGEAATGAIVATASQAGINTVTATGTNPITGEPTNEPTDPAELKLLGAPSLEVIKTIVAGTSDCSNVIPIPGPDDITVEINDTVTYCVTVTNSGATFATGVSVVDDSLTPNDLGDDVAIPGLTDIRLEAGASATGALVTTAAQAGVNTVTASGTDPITGNPTNSPTDPAEVKLLGTPILEVIKTAVAGTADCADVTPIAGPDDIVVEIGDTVTFCVTVTNSGDTTAESVTVVDDSLTPPDPTDDVNIPDLVDITLTPGQSATGALVTVANQTGINTVTANGIDPNTGNPTNSPTDPAELKLLDGPILAVTKTVVAGSSDCVGVAPAAGPDDITVEINDPVTFCVTVTNIGETFATAVTVTDDSLTPRDPADDVSIPGLVNIRLEAGASATGALESTASQAGVNTVTATGTDPITGEPTNEPTDPAEIKLLGPPVLEVVKTAVAAGNVDCADVDPIPGFDEVATTVGATVTFCVTVTNTGATTAEQVTVTDDAFTPDDPGDDSAVAGLDDITLVAGASATGSIIFTVTGQTPQTNTVVATGIDPNTSLATNEPTDTAAYRPPLGNAELVVVKTAVLGSDVDCSTIEPASGEDAVGVEIGNSVTFCITVSNVGDGPAANVVVTDDNFTANPGDDVVVTGLDGIDLLPDESATGSILFVVTELGAKTNVVTATGTDVNGNRPTNEPTDPARLVPFGTPILAVTKTVVAGPAADCSNVAPQPGLDELLVRVGDAVTYCVVVTNTGDGPATNVQAIDDNFTPDNAADDIVLAQADELAPGASLVGSFTKVVATSDAQENTVSATGTDPETGLPTNKPTDPAGTIAPAIDLQKQILRGADQPPNAATEGVNELIIGQAGDAVTWVYTVTNTGSVALIVEEIDDPSIGITVPLDAADQLIAPGDSVTVTANGVVTETGALSQATVLGQPADADGQPAPGFDPLDAADDAGEGPAQIELTKQILRNKDRDCTDAVEGVNELVIAEPGDDITWCYTITNTGISSLTNVRFSDPDLALIDIDVLAILGQSVLAPGESILLPGENDVVPPTGIDSSASVTAVPSDASGDTTDPAFSGAPELDDTNQASNDAISIRLEKRVLLGFDADCSTAIEGVNEGVKGRLGDDITWCFTAINTGSVALRITEIIDETLDITLQIPEAEQILPVTDPQASVTVQQNDTIEREALVNTATVAGSAVDVGTGQVLVDIETGDPIAPVRDENTASEEPLNADLSLDKSKTLPAGRLIVGSIIEYQLQIENKGPDTAQDVEVVDVLPAGLEYVETPVIETWNCQTNAENTELLCEKDRLRVGVVEVLTYEVQVVAGVPKNTDLVNTAVVDFAGVDPTPEDNTDTETVRVRVDQPPVVTPEPTPQPTPEPPEEDEVLPELVYSGAHSDLMVAISTLSILLGSTFLVLSRRRRDEHQGLIR